VRVSQIRRDASVWPRKTLNPDRVSEFLTLYLDQGSSALPPIEVVREGKQRYLVAEGNHRLEAAREAQLETVEVVVLQPPDGLDAPGFCFERGLVSAARSALPLTRAEKHAAIRTLKESRPGLSDREIAALVGASHQTVGRVLRRSNGPDLGQDEASEDGGAVLETAHQAAVKLFLGLERVYAARGLGVWDAITHDHTAERLARVLEEAYGDDALDRATRFATWCEGAVALLQGRWS